MTQPNYFPPEQLVGMPCLSVWQPWPWCIMHAGKDVENRTWGPPKGLRGQWLAIHASKTCEELDQARDSILRNLGIVVPRREELAFGAIVCVVRVVDWSHRSTSKWASPGFVHWELRAVRPLQTPVAYRGSQGIFQIEQATLL